MADSRRRLMKGQVAGICGLMMAGVPLVKACRIVGANYLQARQYVPASFKVRSGRRHKPKKWHNRLLEEVEAVYRDHHVMLSTICELYGVSERAIRNHAREHGWPKRPRGPRPIGPRAMTRKEHTLLRKMRPVVGTDAAMKEIFRHG